jgi:hypothetical protein
MRENSKIVNGATTRERNEKEERKKGERKRRGLCHMAYSTQGLYRMI